jgi:hypothetical protein
VVEARNNPIPFLVFAALVGLALGKWWLGLLVGIAMTIIPGVALIALAINNLLLRVVGLALLAVGFPFYLAFSGARRLAGRQPHTEPEPDDED